MCNHCAAQLSSTPQRLRPPNLHQGDTLLTPYGTVQVLSVESRILHARDAAVLRGDPWEHADEGNLQQITRVVLSAPERADRP